MRITSITHCIVSLSLAWVLTPIICAQDHYTRLRQIDVQHYRFELELSDSSNQITGHAHVRVKFLKAIKSIQLDLVARTSGGKGMEITDVKEDGISVHSDHAGDKITIKLGEQTQLSEVRTYSIAYRGIPADGLIISKTRSGHRTFFGDNWPNRARNWLPTVDHPSDKATVEFVVTAPEHFQVVANGLQVEESSLSKARRLTHWKTEVPIPTKVMVIGVADFAVQRSGDVKGIPITSWVFSEDREPGFEKFSHAANILKYFSKTVGPYPYRKLANVQSTTRFGGMENASCIFYPARIVTGSKSAERLIAHEIAHQWFGNSVSEANWHHIWLSEGFATYLENLYLENAHGRERFVLKMKANRQRVVTYRRAFLSPLVDESVTDYMRLLNVNSYQKGSWVLHMLRRQVGEEKFGECLRQFYAKYKFGNATSNNFRTVVEDVSGQDLKTFFDQWVYSAGHPKLEMDWSYNEKSRKLTLNLRQRQKTPVFHFPIEVSFVGNKADDSSRQRFEVKQAKSTFEVELKTRPTKVVLDPDTWLLYESRSKKKS